MQRYANRFSENDIHPFEVVDYLKDDEVMIREMIAERNPGWKPRKIMDVCENNNDQFDGSLVPPVWDLRSNTDAPVFRIRSTEKGWKDSYGNKYRIEPNPVKYHNFNSRS